APVLRAHRRRRVEPLPDVVGREDGADPRRCGRAAYTWLAMPPKQRQIRIESKSALAAMQQLESRSDEELEAETRFRAAAQAILGARAAERMDAKRTRE